MIGHALTLAKWTPASTTVGPMKAVAVQTFGAPEGLTVIDLPDPDPGAGEVRIATEAIGVGGGDAGILSGAPAASGFPSGHPPGRANPGTRSAGGGGRGPAAP